MKEKFQYFEKKKVSKHINYRVYGVYGFRMLFMPTSFSILSRSSAPVPEMNAFIDSSERLNIYLPLVGKNIFNNEKNGFTDFCGIILFFGSLLALFYGFDTFRCQEYLKFTACSLKPRELFIAMVTARLLVLFLVFGALTGVGFLQVAISGFNFPFNINLGVFILQVLSIAVFFFLLGTLYSTVKSQKTGLAILLSSWFLLVFIFPAAIAAYISRKSDAITPLYQLENEKYTIFSEFEKKVIEKEGIFHYGKILTEPIKRMISSYWNNEFQQILRLEKDMLRQMKANADLFENISAFFPTAFYMSVNSQVSGMGYTNLLDFYSSVLEQKRRFVKFYLDKVYFSNFTELEPFKTPNGNIFYSVSRLPRSSLGGSAINLVYLICLWTISLLRFKRILFYRYRYRCTEGEGEKCPPSVKLELNRREYSVFRVSGDYLQEQLYGIFSRKPASSHKKKKKETSFHVVIDGAEVASDSSTRHFLYLPHPASIPGEIRVKDFVNLYIQINKHLFPLRKEAFNEFLRNEILENKLGKKIRSLTPDEKGEIILEILDKTGHDIILINDAFSDMSPSTDIRLKKTMEKLTQRNVLAIYLVEDDLLLKKSSNTSTGHYFYKTGNWDRVVQSYETIVSE